MDCNLLVRRHVRERLKIVSNRAQRSENLCEGRDDKVLAMTEIKKISYSQRHQPIFNIFLN